MRKIISIVSLAGLVSVLLLSSCDPNENMSKDLVNNTKVNVTIMASSNHVSSAGFAGGRTALADSNNFNEATLGVSWLHFQAEDSTASDSTDVSDSTDMDDDNDKGEGENDDKDDGEDDDEGAKIDGPFIFDLIAGTSTPDFDAAPGPYKGIVVKLAPILPDGNSIFISFDLRTETDTSTVEFSSNTKRAFVIRGDSSLQIDGSSSQVLVLLQIDKLFNGIDFSKAKADEDGTIRISEDSNKRLHNKINSNLAKAFKAGKDNDHDGDIDDD